MGSFIVYCFFAEFYKVGGLLTEQFDNINLPSPRTYALFLSLNTAKYPNNPSSVFCRSTIHDSYTSYADNYALRYTGYFKPVQNGTHEFAAQCNHLCQLKFTKDNNQVVAVTDDIE